MANAEVKNYDQAGVRTVADPRNRKSATWSVRYAPGQSGHIIDKHVKNPVEPWSVVLMPKLLKELQLTPSNKRTKAQINSFKDALLDHVGHSCKRPQALTFVEDYKVEASKPMSKPIHCALLVCHCGLLIALRAIDSNPKIHTAFFRRGVCYIGPKQARWKTVARELRNEYVIAERRTDKLMHPDTEDFRDVEDENGEGKRRRTKIVFVTMHTWGFLQQDGCWRPIGDFPEWNEPKS